MQEILVNRAETYKGICGQDTVKSEIGLVNREVTRTLEKSFGLTSEVGAGQLWMSKLRFVSCLLSEILCSLETSTSKEHVIRPAKVCPL